jgi:hypothetical protein
MLVNRDQDNPHKVRIEFRDAPAGSERHFSGTVSATTFGSAQYQWHPTTQGGVADPDGPALKSTVAAKADTLYDLPKASMTVIRGSIAK